MRRLKIELLLLWKYLKVTLSSAVQLCGKKATRFELVIPIRFCGKCFSHRVQRVIILPKIGSFGLSYVGIVEVCGCDVEWLTLSPPPETTYTIKYRSADGRIRIAWAADGRPRGQFARIGEQSARHFNATA
ncbi:MAG: hypothetical protein V3W19_08025 [Desulfatiglandales bacterium]